VLQGSRAAHPQGLGNCGSTGQKRRVAATPIMAVALSVQ